MYRGDWIRDFLQALGRLRVDSMVGEIADGDVASIPDAGDADRTAGRSVQTLLSGRESSAPAGLPPGESESLAKMGPDAGYHTARNGEEC